MDLDNNNNKNGRFSLSKIYNIRFDVNIPIKKIPSTSVNESARFVYKTKTAKIHVYWSNRLEICFCRRWAHGGTFFLFLSFSSSSSVFFFSLHYFLFLCPREFSITFAPRKKKRLKLWPARVFKLQTQCISSFGGSPSMWTWTVNTVYVRACVRACARQRTFGQASRDRINGRPMPLLMHSLTHSPQQRMKMLISCNIYFTLNKLMLFLKIHISCI